MGRKRALKTRGTFDPRFATALVLLTSSMACKDITSAQADDPAGGDRPPLGSITDTVTVVIENFAFQTPNGMDSVTVSLGQIVRFVNQDAAPHTATSTSSPAGDPGFDSGRMSTGQAYFWAPSIAGVWVYRCDFHPLDMSGAVIRVSDPEVPPDSIGDGGGSPDTIQVDIVNFSFRGPDGTNRIEAVPGQTLKFVNRDDADHTATSTSVPQGASGFDSGNLQAGQIFYWTPAQTGTWGYQCDYHSEMIGSIVVSDSTGGGGGGGGGDDDSGATVRIEIVDGGFVGPNGDGHVTINLGETVKWVNTGSQVHTASARTVPDGGAEFDSGELRPGESFSFTPDRIGVWRYRCDEHSGEPEGTITAQ